MKRMTILFVLASILLVELPDGCKGGNEDHFRQREAAKEKKKAESQNNQPH